jgi:hypothetical protein
MTKQDRVAPRTPADLERRYGKSFNEILGVATDARDSAAKALNETKKLQLQIGEGISAQFSLSIEEDEKKVFSLIDGEATKIRFKSNSIIIESTNFTLTEDGDVSMTGEINATEGSFGNAHITSKGSAYGKRYDGFYLGDTDTDTFFGVNDDPNDSYRAFLALGLNSTEGVLITNKDIQIGGTGTAEAKYISWIDIYEAVKAYKNSQS